MLLALAAYEKAKPYKVDLLQGKWVEAPKPPQGQPQDQPQNVPEVDPVQKEIADLEAQLAKLRMPKIPFCSEEQIKAVSDKAMQAGMERDLVAALQAYGAAPMAGAEDAAKAGEVLRAAVWTTLYLTVTTRAPQQAPQPVPVATGAAMAHQQTIPVFQAAPQVPLQQVTRTHPGPPGKCFRCGMYGHWWRDCVTAAPVPQQLTPQMLQAQAAQWPQASQMPQAHTAPASVASRPPPPSYGGGSHRWGPRRFTRRTRQDDSVMRPGPRLTPAADATATTGAGNHARRDNPACHHNPNPNHSPNPNPSSSASAPGEPGAAGDDPSTNDGTAIQLRCLATSLDAVTAGDVATEPGALAVRAWAESTKRNRRRDLQRVGRTALMYAELDAASALAKHLAMLAAQGRQSATLRGVVSSVRMCETLGIIGTVVTPLHWAICKAVDRAYAHPPPRRVWANAHTLQVPEVRARRRQCQQPGTNSGSASGTRRPAGATPHGTRPGANQVRPPPKTTSRPTQVPGATVRRGSAARDEPAGGAHSLRQVRRRTACAHAGSSR